MCEVPLDRRPPGGARSSIQDTPERGKKRVGKSLLRTETSMASSKRKRPSTVKADRMTAESTAEPLFPLVD